MVDHGDLSWNQNLLCYFVRQLDRVTKSFDRRIILVDSVSPSRNIFMDLDTGWGLVSPRDLHPELVKKKKNVKETTKLPVDPISSCRPDKL